MGLHDKDRYFKSQQQRALRKGNISPLHRSQIMRTAPLALKEPRKANVRPPAPEITLRPYARCFSMKRQFAAAGGI